MWHTIWNIFFSNISMVTMPYPKKFVGFPQKILRCDHCPTNISDLCQKMSDVRIWYPIFHIWILEAACCCRLALSFVVAYCYGNLSCQNQSWSGDQIIMWHQRRTSEWWCFNCKENIFERFANCDIVIWILRKVLKILIQLLREASLIFKKVKT